MIDFEAVVAGLENGEFFVEYLPTVSLNDGRCVGAEALVRWRRPSGIVPAGRFIPLLENTPLSGILTYWVIGVVAEDLRGWLRENPDVHVSINVPPEILGRGGLAHAIQKSGLRNLVRQIIFEITERGIPDLLGLSGILTGARSFGVRFALDDVTMSGANLAILTRCPFSIIKVDRIAVEQIVPDMCHPEWLRGLAAMLPALGVDVIAEGVETAYQAEALREAGVRFAQGFYFCRPTTATGLREFHARTCRGEQT
ncbi:MAG: EAL domain-containing protein [Desulfobacterales bacterium]|nr:EAL domain-containing protein [Desulfobacterales bacterium]